MEVDIYLLIHCVVLMKSTVNVDDAMDDIVHQFNGASDGLVPKVGSSPRPHEISPAITTRILSWNVDEISKHLSWQNTAESAQSISDNEEGDKDGIRDHEEVGPSVLDYGWHSDTELNSKGFPPRVIKRGDTFTSFIRFDEIYNMNGSNHQTKPTLAEKWLTGRDWIISLIGRELNPVWAVLFELIVIFGFF